MDIDHTAMDLVDTIETLAMGMEEDGSKVILVNFLNAVNLLAAFLFSSNL